MCWATLAIGVLFTLYIVAVTYPQFIHRENTGRRGRREGGNSLLVFVWVWDC